MYLVINHDTMFDSQCLFCRIIQKEISHYPVYEDDSVLAFLDINPCSEGHTVVIPKQHFARVADIPEHDWVPLMRGLQMVCKRVEITTHSDGLNVGLNDGPVAGQAVPHLHWHVIPRYKGDGGGSMHSIVRHAGKRKLEEVAQLFAK